MREALFVCINKPGHAQSYRVSTTSQLDLVQRLYERLRAVRSAPNIVSIGITLSEDELMGLIVSLTNTERLP